MSQAKTMPNVIESLAATRDIDLTVDELRDKAGHTTARSFVAQIKAAYTQLSVFPKLGAPRNFSNSKLKNMRAYQVSHFKKYLIFYIVYDSEIEIIRVLHGARNLDAIFAEQNQ